MMATAWISVSRLWNDTRGFTLMEVVIAFGILAAILAILFGTYSAAVERAERTRERSQIFHEGRVLLDLMANDLRSAYVNEPVQQAQGALQQTRPRTYTFVGEDLEEAGLAADRLTFYAFLPVLRPEIPQVEVCRVAYSLEPMADPSQGKILFRRVNCSLDSETTTEGEQVFPLTELARGLDFRYYDAKGEERLEWDSRDVQGGKRLPAWVRIVVLLADQRGVLRPFETSTEIVLGR